MTDENDDQAATPAKLPIVLQVAHCIFTADGRMVHWINDRPEGLYETLPRLFVASLMQDIQGGSMVAGCCLFAIDLEQDRPDFKEKLRHIICDNRPLKKIFGEKQRTIHVQLTKPKHPPAEITVQQIFMDQYIKRGVGGRG